MRQPPMDAGASFEPKKLSLLVRCERVLKAIRDARSLNTGAAVIQPRVACRPLLRPSKAVVALPGSGERDDCLDLDRHAERQLAGADR
jgi:hypothetical protein